MRIRIETTGDLVDLARRQSSPGAGVDPQRILAKIAIRMRKAFAANFAEAGRPHWVPLAASTQREKAAMYWAGIIRGRKPGAVLADIRYAQPMAPGALFALVRTGRLRDSVVRRNKADNITVLDTTTNTVEVGTRVPYGIYHQIGTVRLPKREFLSLTDSDYDDIADIVIGMLMPFEQAVPDQSEDPQ